jgi:hypothetical protein
MVMAVQEIQKPSRTVCAHQCEEGCAIYKNRPESCKGFVCSWLKGKFYEGDRPDRIGVMFYEIGGTHYDSLLLACDEIVPGAIENDPHVKALLELEARTRLVMLWPQEERRKVIGPPELLQRVQQTEIRVRREWAEKQANKNR